MDNNQTTIFNSLTVTASLKSKMQSVALWAKICAISAFVSQGVSLIAGLRNGNFFGEIIGTAIVVFLNILLLNFSTKLTEALDGNNEYSLTESFSNLRRYYLITGILMLIVIGIVILGLLMLLITKTGSGF